MLKDEFVKNDIIKFSSKKMIGLHGTEIKEDPRGEYMFTIDGKTKSFNSVYGGYELYENEEFTVEEIGRHIGGERVYLLMSLNIEHQKFPIVLSQEMAEYFCRVGIQTTIRVKKSLHNSSYSNNTLCPICGAPGYQPFIGNFECSKGCK